MIRLLVAACLLLAAPAAAQCTGENLIDALPQATRATLRARADAVPYPRGNFWQATRDGQTVTLIGTYHLDDPRHDALMARLAPLLDTATTLLVEAGPEEEAALQESIGRDPSVILAPEGSSLAQTLPPEEWAALAEELKARGIPAFIGARFRPSYIAVLLALPPCALAAAADPNGLDKRLIDAAQARGLPVRSLEPFDTALGIFAALDAEVQEDQIRAALALAETGDSQFVTLAEAYFAGDSRIIWEWSRHVAEGQPGTTPEAVAADFALTEDILMTRRNRAWLPVIEAAAAQGPVVAAFGALHLSGETGVLNLLDAAGWSLTPLEP